MRLGHQGPVVRGGILVIVLGAHGWLLTRWTPSAPEALTRSTWSVRLVPPPTSSGALVAPAAGPVPFQNPATRAPRARTHPSTPATATQPARAVPLEIELPREPVTTARAAVTGSGAPTTPARSEGKPAQPVYATPTDMAPLARAEVGVPEPTTSVGPSATPPTSSTAPNASVVTGPARPAAVASLKPPDGQDPLPLSDADYLSNPAPPYPRVSHMLGERGRVVVHVLIGPDGHALQARIAASSGFQRLDAAALNAVTAWRYRPAMRGLAPEARWYVVPVRFEP